MATRDDPSIHRRRLRVELRKARRDADMTQHEAADALEWSLSKLIRIEAGAVGLSVTDLKAILSLYRVTDEAAVAALTEAARGSRGQSWWSRYRDVVSPQLALYFANEGTASEIRAFHPFLVPGLLQTDEYAYELLLPRLGAERARRLVETRVERRETISEQPTPPQMTFVLCEEALHRWIGGPAVMRKQLQYLLDFPARLAASVQVVPFTAGAHAGLNGPFVLLGFEDSHEDLIFLEGAGGDMVNRDDQEVIADFTAHFETIRDLALPDDQAKTLISDLIDRFSTAGRKPGDSAPHVDLTLAAGRHWPANVGVIDGELALEAAKACLRPSFASHHYRLALGGDHRLEQDIAATGTGQRSHHRTLRRYRRCARDCHDHTERHRAYRQRLCPDRRDLRRELAGSFRDNTDKEAGQDRARRPRKRQALSRRPGSYIKPAVTEAPQETAHQTTTRTTPVPTKLTAAPATIEIAPAATE
jgi:transcriptional regulator with XRE-family HTH domain